MRRLSRSYLWMTTIAAILVTVASVSLNLILDSRMKRYHQLHGQLLEMESLVQRLSGMRLMLAEGAEASVLPEEALPLLEEVRERTSRWEATAVLAPDRSKNEVTLALQNYARSLERSFELRWAGNSPEALRWLEEHVQPAAAAVDWRLTGMLRLVDAEIRREQDLRNLVFTLVPAGGLGLVLLLSWRLEVTRQRASRLEQDRLELQLRDRHIAAVLSNMVDAVIIAGPDATIRDVSAGVERVFGYREEEVRGRHGLGFVHPEDLPGLYGLVGRLQGLTREEEWLELRVRHADGSYRHAEVIATNLLEDPEIQGLLIQVRDVTDRKRAAEALHEKERLHRLLTENSAEIVALYDTTGRATYVSPACRTLLGYSPDELLSMGMGEVTHPEDQPRASETMAKALRGQPVEMVLRMRRDTGAYIWVETLIRPVWDETGKLTAIVSTSRNVTERKRFEERLAYTAYHDGLTGLPNRAAFVQQLTERLDQVEPAVLGILYLDLDNFKLINDSLGHEAGDALIMEISARLRQALPEQTLVARFSADEFAILLEEGDGVEEYLQEAVWLSTSFESPVRIGFREVQVTLSLGVTIGRCGIDSASDLMREANIALHHAKQRGKARCVVYHPSMSAGALERLDLDADLRRAIRQGQLSLYWQPIVDLTSGTIAGAEALLRWQHPARGWVPPGEFIPLAEQTGYIDQLGRWVLEEACRQARTWMETEEVDDGDFGISVNLSAIQFQRSQIVEEIAGILAVTGLPAQFLTLEITETALMQNPAHAGSILQRLKALGIRIAVDDFGTGHSSLSYLKQFPVDILKMDRAFVSGLGHSRVDRALAQTVIGLARALDLGVTAEGVELPEQVAELKQLGCEKAQGYLFARPVPAEEMGPMLVRRTIVGAS